MMICDFIIEALFNALTDNNRQLSWLFTSVSTLILCLSISRQAHASPSDIHCIICIMIYYAFNTYKANQKR